VSNVRNKTIPNTLVCAAALSSTAVRPGTEFFETESFEKWIQTPLSP
jgi:hypothetical protein